MVGTQQNQTAVQTPTSGAPTLVKIISVLAYIDAGFLALMAIGSIIGGIVFMSGGSLGAGLGDTLGAIVGLFASLAGVMFLVLGVICIPFAILYFFIGKGLWNGKNWARVVTIVFSLLGVLISIISLIQGSWGSILILLVNGAIAGYFLFSKEAKGFFAK